MPSEKMDANKKEDRNENSLIRMAKVAREKLDPSNQGLDIEGEKNSKHLKTFKAFSKDVKAVKELIAQDALEGHDLNNTCFVSSSVFKQLGGKGTFLPINLTDTFSKLLIGTDPELLIMENGNVKAAHTIPGFSKDSKFGNDGAMAELRPDPAFSEKGLVDNIKKLLTDDDLITHVKDYDWMSTCYYENNQRDYPVGTHVHIDNPTKIAALSQERRFRLFAVTNKILDELLTLPMIRLDGQKGHRRRAKCKMSAHNNGYDMSKYGKGYGFFGEWRSCNGRLEHRSLSGLVMLNPEICQAVFGTAKAIAEAVYKEAIKNDLDNEFILPKKFSKTGVYNDDFKDWGKIPLAEALGCTTASGTISDLMNKSSRADIGKTYISKWLTKMRTLPTYGNFEESIETLGNILSSSAKVLDGFNTNMKNTWKD